MNNKPIFLILVLCLCAACSPEIRPTGSPTPSAEPPTPTSTHTVVPTPLPPTATVSPSPRPSLTPTLTPTLSPTPTKQVPQSGAIVFASSAGSWKKGIFILNFPNMQLVELTGEQEQGSLNYHPSWSPDGKWIVYASDMAPQNHRFGLFDLYLVQPNGQNWHRLTFGGQSWDPDWSPDGQWIAYVINNEIGLISQDGAKSRILTYQPGPKALPTWSPDGRFLAYLYYDPGKKTTTEDLEVWVLEVQSRRSYRVATGAWREPKTLSWSLDGQRIIFGSYLERDCNKLYSVENKENGQVEEIPLPSGRKEGLVWSPNGEWVSYVLSPDSICTQERLDAERKIFRLFIARPDGSNVVELADLPDMNPIQPEWRPLPAK